MRLTLVLPLFACLGLEPAVAAILQVRLKPDATKVVAQAVSNSAAVGFTRPVSTQVCLSQPVSTPAVAGFSRPASTRAVAGFSQPASTPVVVGFSQPVSTPAEAGFSRRFRLGPDAVQTAREVFSREITVERAGEVVVVLSASCAGCNWGEAGREAATLSIAVDGRYSQHVVL